MMRNYLYVGTPVLVLVVAYFCFSTQINSAGQQAISSVSGLFEGNKEEEEKLKQSLADSERQRSQSLREISNLNQTVTKQRGELARLQRQLDETVAKLQLATAKKEEVVEVEEVPIQLASFPTVEPDAKLSGMRVWKDKTGKFEVEAELKERTDAKVVLERASGGTLEVPIGRLSEGDQSFLRRQRSIKGRSYRDMMSLVKELDLDFGGVRSMAISSDKRYFLTGRTGQAATLYNVRTGEMLANIDSMAQLGEVELVNFTPDSKKLVLGGSRGVVEVYKVLMRGKLKLLRQFALHNARITSLLCTPDGKCVLSGDASGKVNLWEIESGKATEISAGFDQPIVAMHVSEDCKRILIADGRRIVAYNVPEESIEREAENDTRFDEAKFSPNGLVLACGGGNNIRLWNLNSFSPMPDIEIEGRVKDIRFAPDSRHIFCRQNGVVNVWDAKTQTRAISQKVGGSLQGAGQIDVSADGSLVFVSHSGNKMKVYKTAALQ